MDKLELALEAIKNCDLCYGQGVTGWVSDEDYSFEYCDCNPNEIILDYDGSVVYDGGTLFTTQEAN